MSHHAQLSPQAHDRYQAQRRSSTVLSIVISILSVALVGLLLAFLILELPAAIIDPIIVYRRDLIDEPPPRPKQLNTHRKPNPAPGGASVAIIVVNSTSEAAVPRPDVTPAESVPFGNGEGIGIGIGDFDGFPNGVRCPIPDSFSKRCGKEDRLNRLRESGGVIGIEDAVVKALRWLKANQGKDGSWGASNKVGMTGLALLAYLGHCETPVSEEFGESCMNAIAYLLDVAAKNQGKMATNFQDRHWPYEHALATYALAEAFTFGQVFRYNIPGHHDAVRDSGQWIIDNQHKSGGWDYSYEEAGARGGDLSITGWHIQALKACKATRIEFRNLRACANNALAYVEARQAPSGGFGYSGTTPAGGGVYSLTGVGALSFQIWGKASHSAARKGVKYLQKNAILDYNGAQSDLYAHYYHSQAMMQHGGVAWTKYNENFAPQLLKAQHADGSFAQPGGGNKVEAVGGLFAQNNPEGIVYRNCLCALMLEVYYRYLPGTSK